MPSVQGVLPLPRQTCTFGRLRGASHREQIVCHVGNGTVCHECRHGRRDRRAWECGNLGHLNLAERGHRIELIDRPVLLSTYRRANLHALTGP